MSARTEQRMEIGTCRLFLTSSGEGSPTVILDGGSGATTVAWSLVEPEVAKFTRVCAFDRAGLGRSDDAVRTPRTSDVCAEELRALLTAAKIPPP